MPFYQRYCPCWHYLYIFVYSYSEARIVKNEICNELNKNEWQTAFDKVMGKDSSIYGAPDGFKCEDERYFLNVALTDDNPELNKKEVEQIIDMMYLTITN